MPQAKVANTGCSGDQANLSLTVAPCWPAPLSLANWQGETALRALWAVTCVGACTCSNSLERVNSLKLLQLQLATAVDEESRSQDNSRKVLEQATQIPAGNVE